MGDFASNEMEQQANQKQESKSDADSAEIGEVALCRLFVVGIEKHGEDEAD